MLASASSTPPTPGDLPSLIPHLSAVAERYLTLLRVDPQRTYDYAARKLRGLEVIEVDHHAPKCRVGESWLYFAVGASTDLTAMTSEDRLYVGAQTGDRMFRGDGLKGKNFHHAQMRAGNGKDTLSSYLIGGRQIAIYRVPAAVIARQVQDTAILQPLRILLSQPVTSVKHLGWWFEQYVLFTERGLWRWNTAQADKSLGDLFR